MINVAIAVNERGALYQSYMLHNLYKVHPNKDIHIWFLYCGDITLETLRVIEMRCKEKYGFEFTIVNIDKKLIGDITNYFSHDPNDPQAPRNIIYPSTFARILIPYLLKVERVLWLDMDIVTLKPLDELFNYDLEDKYIGGVCTHEDIQNCSTKKIAYLFKNKISISQYFNSGVLLYDLTKCSAITLDDCIKFLITEGRNLINLDQDFYNVMYRDYVKILPDIYNFQVAQYYTDTHFVMGLLNPTPEAVYTDLRKAHILHCTGRTKVYDTYFSYTPLKDKYTPKVIDGEFV